MLYTWEDILHERPFCYPPSCCPFCVADCAQAQYYILDCIILQLLSLLFQQLVILNDNPSLYHACSLGIVPCKENSPYSDTKP